MVTISFIMPAYKAAYIRKAIESIIAQTVPDWELVVVDDCSPENLEEIVKEFKDPRIRYERNSKNLGGHDLVEQWNHSISFAHGDWIVLAGDDDMYDPRFAERIIDLASKYPTVNLIRSRVEQIGEKGEHLGDDGKPEEFEAKEKFFEDYLDAKAFTCIGNYAFRRCKLAEIGGFFELPCAFGSDIVTPILMSDKGVAGTEEMLFKFRISSIHLSSNTGKLAEKQEAVNCMFEWFESIGYIRAFHARLHAKYIYDIFNLVVVHMPLKSVLGTIAKCRLATLGEKIIMMVRWTKRQIIR